MNFKFHKVIIDNFLSFGHAEVDLEERGYTLIRGINNNPKDSAKSNGSGKSTIFSAICYALTGETIQGLSSNLKNIFTDGDMKVQLDFKVDSDEFSIIRSKSSELKSDLKVYINGEDKSGKGIRESEEILKEKIPDLSSDLIGEVILIGQGMPHKFSSYKASGRKELLEKLSHSDFMIEDVRNRVDRRIETLKEEKEKNLLDQTTTKAKIEAFEETIKKKEEELSNLTTDQHLDEKIKETESQLTEKEKEQKELSTSIEEDKKTLNGKTTELNVLREKRQKELDEELSSFNEVNLTTKKEITEKETSIRLLKEEITKLQSIKDVCPMCHQKLPHVHKQDTTEQGNKKTLLEEELKVLKEKDTKQTENHTHYVTEIKNSYFENENTLNSFINFCNNRITNSNIRYISISQMVQQLSIDKAKLIQQKESLESNISKCSKELSEVKGECEAARAHLLYLIRGGEDIENHLQTVNKMSTLIKRDFRGLLLSNIIKYIDAKCKSYSKEIFGHDELAFELNGNNIDISFQKKPLEALSGGEKQKVDLITQFAIRSMMEEFTGFHSNILVLDEILDNLDSVGCDSVLNFITSKLSDIESIFIISHHADSLNIGNDSTITVVKDAEGVSSVI